MGIRLIGNRQDAIAFGLAGLDTVECRTRAELALALESAQGDPLLALVIISPAVAALGPDLVARVRDSSHPPITVVLPPYPDESPRAHAA
jgi:vacuolar-type H+-ATPase subunit F/Vma7